MDLVVRKRTHSVQKCFLPLQVAADMKKRNVNRYMFDTYICLGKVCSLC